VFERTLAICEMRCQLSSNRLDTVVTPCERRGAAMSRWVAFALCAARLVLAAGTAHAAAVLIPDHTHRLGSCGSGGGSCTWDCRDVANACEANGPSCPAPATCKLDATDAFRGVVS